MAHTAGSILYIQKAAYYSSTSKVEKLLVVTVASSSRLPTGPMNCSVSDFVLTQPNGSAAALGDSSTCTVANTGAALKVTLSLGLDANVQRGGFQHALMHVQKKQNSKCQLDVNSVLVKQYSISLLIYGK